MLRVFLLLLVLPLYSVAASTDPYERVRTATDQLLARLIEVQPLYESDPNQFFAAVEDSLAPFIDFEGFSRGVMAKYYRRATDTQKARFAETFQHELIQTYAKALVEFDNQKVDVLRPTEPPERGRATINLEVHGSNGTIYPITYTMADVDGEWKLRNVVIDGINIGLQFRSQFADYMQQHRGDIDAVIENWSVDVSN